MKRYHMQDTPNYVVYCIKIQDKNIFKIGKTNRLKYRIINLNQGIYENWDFYRLITCKNNKESYCIERQLLKKLSPFRIPHKKEWFQINCITFLHDALSEIETTNQVSHVSPNH